MLFMMLASTLYGRVWSVTVDVDHSADQRERLERLLSGARLHVALFQYVAEEEDCCAYTTPHHHFIVWCNRSVWGELMLPSVMRDSSTRVALAESDANLDFYLSGEPPDV